MVTSCALKFIKSLSPEIKHLIAYSDCCGGQNINKILSRMWFYIVSDTNMIKVDHKYLVSSHTYLENDSDFLQIEKLKRKTEYICH